MNKEQRTVIIDALNQLRPMVDRLNDLSIEVTKDVHANTICDASNNLLSSIVALDAILTLEPKKD